ncbi:MAG: outer membrane protein assembly factor BamB [Verrucomicrobiales bacterium]|jgi:outer membrane protein assembly factor BamB
MTKKSLFAAIVAACILIQPCSAAPEDEEAEKILRSIKASGGFVVHLGSGDGKLTNALGREGFVVHGLDRRAENIAEARKNIENYGTVSVEQLLGDRLPYLDGIVNLIVVEPSLGIEPKEIKRVLCPGGIALLKSGDAWIVDQKPWPDEIDDWSHYLHGPGGNAVAQDTVVGPPRHMKWVGSPRWSRHHDRMASMSALVSDAGKLFYIMDEGSRISIQMPPKWKVVARDAFNGVILWKRDIVDWHSHLYPLKSGPTQLARRLVAADDAVFTTLGIKAPVTMLDARNGETIRVFEDSDGTEELVVADGVCYLMAIKDSTELDKYLPEEGGVGDQGKVAARYKWDELPRAIMAFDTKTGEQLWVRVGQVSPLTISSDGERFYYHDGSKVVAIDGRSGEEIWTGKELGRRDKMTTNFGPKLVVEGGQVYFAGGDRLMHVYDAKTGEEKWNAPHARGGYQSPEDLLIMKDLVWSAPLTSGKDSGVFTGRRLDNGEVVKEFAPNVETYWFHHRCYIAKATSNYLMPSRTGIEFVDPDTESWDINHWVRGGCLYGVMPANGLTYAPPHNCACYPEAKLYGFNALSSTGPYIDLDETPGDRLFTGPAFGKITERKPAAADWPTFRQNSARSGSTAEELDSELEQAWEIDLGGRLSSLVSAGDRIYVAQIDQHRVHALNASSGETEWTFTTGGRVDSPPTIHNDSVIFGSADGFVYCVCASDGELAWKLRASPSIERHMAFEQLESVWPVHGSILVEGDEAYFIAGRSNFLDGGLRFFKVNATTGEVVNETVINEFNPETGKNLQEKVATLQMPAGLPDILAYQGGYIYMRSQQFDLNGERLEIGPHSADAATQGAVQKGGEHLFAPMSYLDDTYFHRAYWVFGKSFAGGHNGYYQAGKNAASGRLLVADAENVYGFGRKPEYLRWTTVLEHQLFSAPREAPEGALSAVDDKGARRGAGGGNKPAGGMIMFQPTKAISPVKTALGVEAWVKISGKGGVIAAHGGPAQGYALVVQGSRPAFLYRSTDNLFTAAAKKGLADDWTHLVGQITEDRKLQLFVNGKLAVEAEAEALIPSVPAQSLQIGGDDGSAVGEYQSPFPFKGALDEVGVFHGAMTAEEITARFEKGPAAAGNLAEAKFVVACSFDKGGAEDSSGMGNHGANAGAGKAIAEGKFGGAMQFAGKAAGGANRGAGSLVQHHWTADAPLFARAMVLTGKNLFVAGPPDLYDEAETFEKLTDGDPEVQKLLERQDAALNGSEGGVIWITNVEDGSKIGEIKIDALPSWDGMIAAGGQLLLSTTDGRVIAFK